MGDVVNFFSGLTYHPSDVKNKGYFVIRSSNIQNNQIVSADDIFVNKDIINVPNVKQGDIIVVVRNGSRKLIGKHAQVLTDMPNTVIGAFMTGVRSKSNFYINALLDSDQFQKEIYKNLGATINQITIGEFRKMRFIITSGNEAQTIGEFFKKIDTLITLQQRKLEQLTQLKKAMLQQLFADKNSKQPNLRFKNFKGDWEQHKLKSVVSVNSGKDYKSLEKGNIPVYGTGGYITSVSKSLSNQDAIGLGRKGTINKPYILKAPFWTVDTLFYLTLKPENILTFIYSLIQKINWLKYDESTGLPSLSKKNIKNVLVSLTKLDEQQKIGKVIVKLDKFITLHQSKIDQLTILKKYLLQKLFI